MIPRNPVGTYPGIYARDGTYTRSTGCRSCGGSKSSKPPQIKRVTVPVQGRSNMTLTPAAANYLSAKATRARLASNTSMNPQSGRLQTTPQTTTKTTSNDMSEALKQSLKRAIVPNTNPVPPNQIVRPDANTRQYYTAPQLTDDNWDSIISNISQPICILFSTKHCGACRDFRATTWQDAYWTYKDRMALFEFDCGMDTKQDKEHDALSHPTIVFYHKGKEVGTYLGHSIFQYFRDYVDRLLDKLKNE